MRLRDYGLRVSGLHKGCTGFMQGLSLGFLPRKIGNQMKSWKLKGKLCSQPPLWALLLSNNARSL